MTKPDKITIGRFGEPKLGPDGQTMVVSIPISFRRQGGRKTVVTPSHTAAWSPHPPRIDNIMVKAMVRAHRWRNMLESNLFAQCANCRKRKRSTSPIYAGCCGSPCSHRS
jgi:hypothetical protein